MQIRGQPQYGSLNAIRGIMILPRQYRDSREWRVPRVLPGMKLLRFCGTLRRASSRCSPVITLVHSCPMDSLVGCGGAYASGGVPWDGDGMTPMTRLQILVESAPA